jgi:formiminoglutamase
MTDLPLLVPEKFIDRDARTPFACVFGADFSALSITPQRADQAPSAVRMALPRFAATDAAHGLGIGEGRCVLDLMDARAAKEEWPGATAALRGLARGAYRRGLPLAIGLGGDHSVSWPLIEAYSEVAGERIGVIQLDAHHDVRPLADGPSNGTPFRGLIENDIVQGADIVQIGINPAVNKPELPAWCDSQGIHRITRAELDDMTAAQAIDIALRHLVGCDAVYLSVDIDVLDVAYAPGTVAAVAGGIDPQLLNELVDLACADPRVRAMDVVEFDPTRDQDDTTALNVARVVMTALTSVARREA